MPLTHLLVANPQLGFVFYLTFLINLLLGSMDKNIQSHSIAKVLRLSPSTQAILRLTFKKRSSRNIFKKSCRCIFEYN